MILNVYLLKSILLWMDLWRIQEKLLYWALLLNQWNQDARWNAGKCNNKVLLLGSCGLSSLRFFLLHITFLLWSGVESDSPIYRDSTIFNSRAHDVTKPTGLYFIIYPYNFPTHSVVYFLRKPTLCFLRSLVIFFFATLVYFLFVDLWQFYFLLGGKCHLVWKQNDYLFYFIYNRYHIFSRPTLDSLQLYFTDDC